MKKVLVLYVPAIHDGYEKLFESLANEGIQEVYILKTEMIKEFMPLHEEIRALKPERARLYLQVSGFFREVLLLDNFAILDQAEIVMPNDELSRQLAQKYLQEKKISFRDIWLRHDEKSIKTVQPINHKSISTARFDRQMILLALAEKNKSSDWWRQIGAVLVIDQKVALKSFNQHVPSEYLPYLDGDPRDFISAGENTELATAKHSERGIIYEAAKLGIKLEGASIYITAFPCNVCAEAIAYSGIKKCFFVSGWANLNSQRVLEANGVKIILVK